MGRKNGVFTSGTKVHYKGSLPEFKGRTGFVVATTSVNPAAFLLGLAEKVADLSPLVRYSVRFTRVPGEVHEPRLDDVRHQSLIHL